MFTDEIRKLVQPDDYEYLCGLPDVETDKGIWCNTEADLPENLKKPIAEMSDADMLEFVELCALKNQAVSLGVPLSEKNLDVFWQQFKCENCGRCCREPIIGGIAVMPSEVRRLAAELVMSEDKFRKRYTVSKAGAVEMQNPCPFHSGTECIAYKARPLVCHVFPLELSIGRALGELAVQAVCPAARKMFVEMTKERRDHGM